MTSAFRNVSTFPRSHVPTILPVIVLGLVFIVSTAAHAQLSDRARASVVTVYPGNELYSSFGHTAIRISDPERELDRLYNYGTFDFDDPSFYLKFIRGKLDYRLSVGRTQPLFDRYERLGRSTVEQHLQLPQPQIDSLYRRLEINYRPENRYYRYDFFFDNCATRPRDMLEEALDSLAFNFREDAELRSFREHLDPYINDRPLIHFGIDLALGRPTDRIAEPYETMFLPVELMEKLERATLITNGQSRPLVAETDTLYWNEARSAADAPFPWIDLVLWIGFGAALFRTWHEFRTPSTPSTWTYRVDAGIYAVIGLIGLVIALLWAGTEHAAVVGPNLNLLWAWPTHLIAGHFLWRTKNPRPLRVYLLLSAAASFLVLIGWYWWPQQIPSAVVPVLLWQIVRGIRYALEHRTFTVVPRLKVQK